METENRSKQQESSINVEKAEAKEMSGIVNLLDMYVDESVEPMLERVRIGSDEAAFIPFTAQGKKVNVHFCSETEINDYVICNGDGCVLCRIGRKPNEKLLLPVYLPAERCVGVLPMGRSYRPHALLPQILNVLKADREMVVFATREGPKYTISTTELPKDIDGGETAIKRFLEELDAGLHDLSKVYLQIDNQQLADIEGIGKIMDLKGINRDANNKRS